MMTAQARIAGARCADHLAARLLLLLIVFSAGCYRAVYTDLAPPGAESASGSVPRPARSSSWRNFYVYGYVPPQVVVDAGAECGGAERVREIRTRQTFTQGLIRSFASSSGVNVYAPWTGEVVCIDDVRRRER
jgi:hypothetical protein